MGYLDEDDKGMVRELGGIVADEVAARFAAGWPMIVPDDAAADLAAMAGRHGVAGQAVIGYGPVPYRLGWAITSRGELRLDLAGPNGERLWNGTLKAASGG